MLTLRDRPKSCVEGTCCMCWGTSMIKVSHMFINITAWIRGQDISFLIIIGAFEMSKAQLFSSWDGRLVSYNFTSINKPVSTRATSVLSPIWQQSRVCIVVRSILRTVLNARKSLDGWHCEGVRGRSPANIRNTATCSLQLTEPTSVTVIRVWWRSGTRYQ